MSRLRPPASLITLKHFLAHTSGFVYDVWNESLGEYAMATGLPGLASLQKAAFRAPLTFDPGTN